MKITKPKDNQILLEDDCFKEFNLEVKSKTGLSNTAFNNVYEALILGYRLPNMDASKQMFLGDTISIMTLVGSMLENLIDYGAIDEEMLEKLVESVKEFRRLKNDN